MGTPLERDRRTFRNDDLAQIVIDDTLSAVARVDPSDQARTEYFEKVLGVLEGKDGDTLATSVVGEYGKTDKLTQYLYTSTGAPITGFAINARGFRIALITGIREFLSSPPDQQATRVAKAQQPPPARS